MLSRNVVLTPSVNKKSDLKCVNILQWYSQLVNYDRDNFTHSIWQTLQSLCYSIAAYCRSILSVSILCCPTYGRVNDKNSSMLRPFLQVLSEMTGKCLKSHFWHSAGCSLYETLLSDTFFWKRRNALFAVSLSLLLGSCLLTKYHNIAPHCMAPSMLNSLAQTCFMFNMMSLYH